MGPKAKKGKAPEGSPGPKEPDFKSVEEVETLLKEIKTSLKDTKDGQVSNLPEMLLQLTAAVTTLVSQLKEIPRAAKARERLIEDELDDARQRSMKGNLVISSTKGSNFIQTEEMLLAKNSDPKTYALTLVEEKYSVKLEGQDVQDCHFLPGGNIILRIWNTAPKSGFRLLVDRIKSGKGKADCPIYINFQMTKRRSTVLFHLRNLKREGKIQKFYSDENGSISVRIKEGAPKIKLTNFPTKKGVPGAPLRTVKNREDILELLDIEDTEEEGADGGWS